MTLRVLLLTCVCSFFFAFGWVTFLADQVLSREALEILRAIDE